MVTGQLKSFSLKVLSSSNQHLALDVAHALPEWFTADQLTFMKLDLTYQRGAIAMDGENPIGFISFFVNHACVEIAWMGVRPEYQNQGIGKFLLTKLVNELKVAGAKEMRVRTLADSIKHEPFERTRAFFRNFGFEDSGVTKNSEGSEFAEDILLSIKL